jgi:hypothetical protein
MPLLYEQSLHVVGTIWYGDQFHNDNSDSGKLLYISMWQRDITVTRPGTVENLKGLIQEDVSAIATEMML